MQELCCYAVLQFILVYFATDSVLLTDAKDKQPQADFVLSSLGFSLLGAADPILYEINLLFSFYYWTFIGKLLMFWNRIRTVYCMVIH